jgi:hypothetical protein
MDNEMNADKDAAGVKDGHDGQCECMDCALDRGAASAPAEQSNPCKLTECQGQPRCAKCVACGLNEPPGVAVPLKDGGLCNCRDRCTGACCPQSLGEKLLAIRERGKPTDGVALPDGGQTV